MFDFLRNWTKSAEDRQQEVITAYLDDALSSAERLRFEEQMAQEPALQAEVAQQRQTRQLLRQLPPRQVPRNFTLDPAVYGRPARQPLVTYYPALRAATVLTAVLFFFAIGLGIFTSGTSMNAPMADTAVSQLSIQSTSEATGGVAAESATMADENPPAAIPFDSVPAAEPAEEEMAEEEMVDEGAVAGYMATEAPAPEAPEGAGETAVLPEPTPSAAATNTPEPLIEPLTEPLPTATTSGLPRLSATATVVAERAVTVSATAVAATGDPLALVVPESDGDTAVANQEQPPSTESDSTVKLLDEEPSLNLLVAAQLVLLILLVVLLVLTLYARRRRV